MVTETKWEVVAELLSDGSPILASKMFDDRERAEKVAWDMAQNDQRLFVSVWEITRRQHIAFSSDEEEGNGHG